MKLVTFFSILFSFYSFGCDVCNVFEYANHQNKHYIGVFYRNRMFNGFSTLEHTHNYQLMPSSNPNARIEHEPESTADTKFSQTKKDFEFYQSVEIRANYALSSKFNIQFILPYNWSDVYFSEVTQYMGSATRPFVKKDSAYGTHGIGDIILMIDYLKTVQTSSWKHLIKPGIGFKLPTGAISHTYKEGNRMHPDLQPGTGSVDVLVRFNYMLTNDIWGVDLFTNYRFCTKNSINYTFGNRFNITALMYYTFTLKKLKVLPKVGVYTEYAQNDKLNDKKLLNTGGYTYFTHLGIDFMFGKMVLQTVFQKPYFEYLYGDIPGNAGRLSMGLIYNF